MTRSASVPSRRGGPAIRRYRRRRLPEPRPAVRRVSCGTVPCRYSPNVLRPDGLHTRMMLPPAARTASQSCWRAWRSSSKWTGRSPIMEGPTRAGRRRAAPAVPFAVPVPGTHELRRQRQDPALARRNRRRADEAVEIPRFTAHAARRALTAVQFAGSEMLRVVRCHQHTPVQTPHPRKRPGPSGSATIAGNTPPKWSGGTPSGIWRMRLPHWTRPKPNGVRVRDAPTRRKELSVRQKGRKQQFPLPDSRDRPRGVFTAFHVVPSHFVALVSPHPII